ncbi:hypothetical protein [Reinekea sp. G2M2-21]|uniref:hypothetical protein n=1 Tax=Reinekea sp. G2M2-21 TaxID=2788942 RepID=UPI0018AAD817|nr:hypothetical protein [Reinekea sp. G2M2-21]
MKNTITIIFISLLLYGCYAGNVITQSFYSENIVVIELEKLFSDAGYERCNKDLYENAFCSIRTGYLSFFMSVTENDMLIEMYVVHVSGKTESQNELEAITNLIESNTTIVRGCTKSKTQWGLVGTETDSCEGS